MNNFEKSVPPFLFAAHLDKCPVDRPVFVEVAGREMALVRLGASEEVICLDNVCPHARANLAGGEVEYPFLVCPQHHWKFHLHTGACEGSPHVGVNRYEVRIEGGKVYVCPEPIVYRPPLQEM